MDYREGKVGIIMEKSKKRIELFLCAIMFASSSSVKSYVDNDSNFTGMFLNAVFDFCLFVAVYYIFSGRSMKYVSREQRKLEVFFEKGTYLKIFLLLMIFWMPVVILRYPGIQSGGVEYQIQSFMGMDTLARSLSPITYEGHYITGHHPVLLTLIFGSFIKVGLILGNASVGMFLLSCCVCILNGLGWAYVIYSLFQEIEHKFWVRGGICFLINPMIISLNTYVLKDNLFATALAVYCVLILKICKKGRQKRYEMGVCFFSVLIPFIKNQGIYIVLITSIVLAFYMKNELKIWIGNAVLAVLIYVVLFSHILMPCLQIAPGGRQEMLGILFQMTARVMIEHSTEIDNNEAGNIHKVLPVEDWTVYEPNNSDNIKFQYNQSAEVPDIAAYLGVWLKQGLRYPESYIRAVLEQTYGYYCIDYKTVDWNWKETYFFVSPNHDLVSGPMWEGAINKIYDFLSICTQCGRISYLFNIAVSFWIIVMCCLVHRKRRDWLWIFPIFLQWCTCLVSPIGGSGRYGMLVYEMVPWIIVYTIEMKKVTAS